MVAIQDEVEAPYLVEAYRRQLLTPVEGSVYALPPLLHTCLSGHEVSIELRTSAYATRYLSYWHCPHASIDSPHCPGDLSRVIEAEQSTGSAVSLQAGTDAPKQGSSAGAGEVFIHLLFEAHVTNHLPIPFLAISHLGAFHTCKTLNRLDGLPKRHRLGGGEDPQRCCPGDQERSDRNQQGQRSFQQVVQRRAGSQRQGH